MPIPKDYRKYPNPKMWSTEILFKLKEMKMHEFTSKEISDLFQVNLQEACTRISLLKKWNCIKEIKSKLIPRVYKITAWGHKYIEANWDTLMNKMIKRDDFSNQ